MESKSLLVGSCFCGDVDSDQSLSASRASGLVSSGLRGKCFITPGR